MKLLKVAVFLILNIYFVFSTLAYANFNDNIFNGRKTIAIDLDGVLDDYDGKYDENNIPKIKMGAKDFIIELSKNYNLILFTNRKPMAATKWLIDNEIDKYFKNVTNVKPAAYIYLDDRALKFEGDYNKTIDDINNYKTHWKRD